jgi:hypothetical protein
MADDCCILCRDVLRLRLGGRRAAPARSSGFGGAMASESTKSVSLKQRAASEMDKYLVIAIFLSALLVALTA